MAGPGISGQTIPQMQELHSGNSAVSNSDTPDPSGHNHTGGVPHTSYEEDWYVLNHGEVIANVGEQ